MAVSSDIPVGINELHNSSNKHTTDVGAKSAFRRCSWMAAHGQVVKSALILNQPETEIYIFRYVLHEERNKQPSMFLAILHFQPFQAKFYFYM